jgi:hypothetical protein
LSAFLPGFIAWCFDIVGVLACAGLNDKLAAEVVKSLGLEKELSKVKGSL